MQVNHNFTQEVYIPALQDFAEVGIATTCDCERIRRQPDVGIFRDYLELEGVTIDSIYFDGEEITDPKVHKAVSAFIDIDHDKIETRINEEN